MYSWGIIGGGIMGMTIAHRLAQQGCAVTIFEAEEDLGGLASSWQLGDFSCDRHYHVILLSDTHTRSILNELGLEKNIRWEETKSGFYTDSHFYSMSNTLEFLTFPPLHIIDKFRLGLTILYASKVKDGRKLEGQYVADWLRKWSGNNTYEKLWLPLLRAKLGDSYHDTSAAFIWATIQRMYAARNSGLKKERFGYLPGGYAPVIEVFSQLLNREKVSIKKNHLAHRVSPTGDGKFQIQCSNGLEETFNKIILTLPSPVSARLCDILQLQEKSKLEEIRYLGVICASLLLKKPLSKFYVTNITDSGYPFTGVIEMTALVDRKYFGGNTLVYLPKYALSHDSAFKLSDHEVQDQFFPALKRLHPALQDDDLLAFKVSRADNVFALPVLHYSQKLPPVQTSTPGIYIVNSAHILNGTANVNESIRLAEHALLHILR